MSDSWQNAPGYQPPSQTAGVTDVVTQLQNIVLQLSSLVRAINGRVTSGTFLLGAAATTVVSQPATQALSTIQLTPTNASAATLMGSNKALYISARVAGTSFTVATASGAAAAGTETFSYTINTPT